MSREAEDSNDEVLKQRGGSTRRRNDGGVMLEANSYRRGKVLLLFFSRTDNPGQAGLFNDAFHGMIARDRRVVEDLGDIRRRKGALFCTEWHARTQWDQSTDRPRWRDEDMY